MLGLLTVVPSSSLRHCRLLSDPFATLEQSMASSWAAKSLQLSAWQLTAPGRDQSTCENQGAHERRHALIRQTPIWLCTLLCHQLSCCPWPWQESLRWSALTEQRQLAPAPPSVRKLGMDSTASVTNFHCVLNGTQPYVSCTVL